MSQEIVAISVPQWGLEMTEGEVAQWLIAPGDRVAKGQAVVEIETAKIVNTLEAQRDYPGVVRRLVAAVGETLPVGALIAVMADESVPEAAIDQFIGSVAPGCPVDSLESATGSPEAVGSSPGIMAPRAHKKLAGECEVTPVSASNTPVSPVTPSRVLDAESARRTNDAVFASPVAKRVANAMGVDITAVKPTGRGGRVSLDDVRSILPGRENKTKDRPAVVSMDLQAINAHIFASPIARRVAIRNNVDLRGLAGHGRHGRISLKDVESFVSRHDYSASNRMSEEMGDSAGVKAGPAARLEARRNGIPLESIAPSGPRKTILKTDVVLAAEDRDQSAPAVDYEDIVHSSMRKAIAANMQASKQNVPHFYTVMAVDVSDLLALRTQLNEDLNNENRISVNDFVLRAAAMTLKEFPEVNAHYLGDRVRRFREVHLALAIALDEGLVTPVIHQAEDLTVRQLGQSVRNLSERAKSRRLASSDMTGGTFTVSNLGMFGISEFSAIISVPQCAILAVSASQRQAVELEGDRVGFRSVMKMTLSCDHRAVDGALAARFLQSLKARMESPIGLLS